MSNSRFFQLFLPLILYTAASQGQTHTFCKNFLGLRTTIEEHHVLGPLKDDTLAARWHTSLLTGFDPEGLFYTKAEAAQLKSSLQTIIQYPSRACQEFQTLSSHFSHRLRTIDSLIARWEKQAWQWEKQETFALALPTSANESTYPGSLAEITASWLRLIKLESLLGTTTKEPVPSDSIRRAVTARFRCRLKRYLPGQPGGEARLGEIFLNALAEAYDPHSNYFPPSLMQQFTRALSSTAPSFGFQLTDSPSGKLIIAEIIPGGPAWRSNSLHVGDQLVGLSLPQLQISTIGCMEAAEIEEVLAASPATVEFQFKRTNGQLFTITLSKESLKVTDNRVTGYILKKPTGTIGYVSLPAFYTHWENETSLGCANDVAKEILKLKRENIQGLVIDLRYNGGGSLGEALGLAGLFIDQGTLLQGQKYKTAPERLRDPNRGTVYDGPLLLLVNGYSASAAEIVAGILQEYHRAIIAGSTTFGKASGQIIVPLPNRKGAATAFVKVTDARFFQLNGNSYQAKGIVPDILLPTEVVATQQEKELAHHLPSYQLETTQPASFLPPLPLAKLAENSQKRIEHDSAFIVAGPTAATAVPPAKAFIRLHPENFWSDWLEIMEPYYMPAPENDALAARTEVANSEFDAEVYAWDEHQQLLNDRTRHSLARDAQLSEACHILLDLFFEQQMETN